MAKRQEVKGFYFKDETVLRAAMASGKVPLAVQRGEVYVVRDRQGLWARIDQRALGEVQLPIRHMPEGPTQCCSCWAEAFSLVPEPDPNMQEVVFLLRNEEAFLNLVGELIRLGCSQQVYATDGNRYLLKATAAPYYTVLRALDGQLKAYCLQTGMAWVELGWRHPLLDGLEKDQRKLVLISRTGWLRFPEPEWRSIDAVVKVIVQKAEAFAQKNLDRQLAVPLYLAPGAPAPTTLWVLRQRGLEQVEALVHTLPQDVADRLLFAAGSGHGGEHVVALKARNAGVELAIDNAEEYTVHPQLRNLFLPRETRIEPPLRRDQLRSLLAPHSDQLVWLRQSGRDFTPESLPDAAFSPLDQLIEYVISLASGPLESWMKSSIFRLGAVHIITPKAAPEQPKQAKASAKPTWRDALTTMKAQGDDVEAEPEPEPEPQPEPSRHRQPRRAQRQQPRAGETPELLARLVTLEHAYNALDESLPANAPERLGLWAQLAEANAAIGRHHESGLCWVRVIWEGQGDDALADWAATEQALANAPNLDAILAMSTPSRDAIRAGAAAMIVAEQPSSDEVVRWQEWVRRHEDSFDVRTLWLVRQRLSSLVGGDELALATARDAILARLHNGLSPEREVPAFLRNATSNRPSAEELLSLRNRINARPVKPMESPCTPHYVALTIAFGLARLGAYEQARSLATEAEHALNTGDTVHSFLVRAYQERTEQAINGTMTGQLSAPLMQELNGTEKFLRYKIDRLRQASEILSMNETLDPVAAFRREMTDIRGREFANLRTIEDPQELAAAVAELYRGLPSLGGEDQLRIMNGICDLCYQLPGHVAVDYIRAAAQHPAESLNTKALMLAAHFGMDDTARAIIGRLAGLYTSVPADQLTAIVGRLPEVLRALRRAGLPADELLGRLASLNDTSFNGLLVRLQLGAAEAYMGRVTAFYEPAFQTLTQPELVLPNRLRLCRVLARSLASLPQETAVRQLRRLEDIQLASITDPFNTNSHYCLSVVSFVESLVWGYVSDDLAIDAKARRLIDDEEYRIRRRIHMDMQTV